VKIADKLTNVHDVTHNPPIFWTLKRRTEYFDWSDAVVAGLRGQNSELESRYDRAVSEGRMMLNSNRHP
jgi:hypothetical protein